MVYGIRDKEKILLADVSLQPDWNQTNEAKKDFIKNKPDFEKRINELETLLAAMGSIDSSIIRGIQDNIKDLEDGLDDLKNSKISKDEFDDVISGLETTINELESKTSDLETSSIDDKAELEGKLKDLEDAIEDLKGLSADDVEEIKEKIDDIEEIITEIEAALAEIRADSISIHEGLETKIDELKEITSKIKEYKITFDINGGEDNTCPESFSTVHNVFIISPMIPLKSDEYFQGWSLDSDATVADYLPNKLTVIDKSITLYAVWGDEEIDLTDGSKLPTAPPTWQQIINSGHIGIQNGFLVISNDGINWYHLDLPDIQDIHWGFAAMSNEEIVVVPNIGNISGRLDESLQWTINDIPVEEDTEWESIEYV